jgi:hypothetical protein
VPAQQKELLACPPPPAGTVYVNDRVSFRTEGTQRVISVHGVVFAHYGVEDRAAEAYAMVTLTESGYATQTQIARAFGTRRGRCGVTPSGWMPAVSGLSCGGRAGRRDRVPAVRKNADGTERFCI